MTSMPYLRRVLLMAAATLAAGPAPGAPSDDGAARHDPPIDLAAAAQIFREAREISARDGGRLWGVPLYGPILLVDPESRFVVANQADAGGLLKPDGGVFTGTLPASEQFANTAATWSGTWWTEMAWPLPENAASRDTLIGHELFHRIRDQLHLPALRATDNAQLDTLQGRYLLQLEWRALSRALAASSEAVRRSAVTDALLFRGRRHQLFPTAADEEGNLESNEGLAEYTGVEAGAKGRAARIAAAQRDLTSHAGDASFTRAFAYATGPAYGLLLDRYLPAWRGQLTSGRRFDELLTQALHLPGSADLAARVETRAALYDGVALLQSETALDVDRQKRIAQFQVIFIDHPVLVLPLTDRVQVQFDPRNVQSFPAHGNVYPVLSVSDDWGNLDSQKAALIAPGWHAVTVAAPTATGGSPAGEGWTLTLTPGWRLVAGPRAGDYTLAPPDQKP